ncbi:unnamed protein product [Microthlaspi erraticum]|uniref:DOG1 domain-containing protein n=1 Tax=Microthlaspi erraticum TaxID=1685480 RepID=A0A6D2J604_9BRAS|nr:unnamed protein product [Microthlaspi erraticum]
MNDFKKLQAVLSNKLTDEYIPLLRRSLSSGVLKTDVDTVLDGLVAHYESVDHAVNGNTIGDIYPCLFTNLETPFLLFGDIHPYLFTNLLRSFIERDNEDSHQVSMGLHLNEAEEWKVVSPWKDSSARLMERLDILECRTRMMVPAFLEQMRAAQREYVVARVSEIFSNQGNKKVALNESFTPEQLDDFVQIFLAANRLRKRVLLSLVDSLTLDESARFLEAVCHILVGFKDQVYGLTYTEEGKRDNTILVCNFIYGVIVVPPLINLIGRMNKREMETTAFTFAGAVYGALVATFVASMVQRRGLRRALKDALWGALTFAVGGAVPLVSGMLIPSRSLKTVVTVVLTGVLVSLVLSRDYKSRPDPKQITNTVVLLLFTLVAIGISVAFADTISRL